MVSVFVIVDADVYANFLGTYNKPLSNVNAGMEERLKSAPIPRLNFRSVDTAPVDVLAEGPHEFITPTTEKSKECATHEKKKKLTIMSLTDCISVSFSTKNT
jgi:histone H3/H4